MNDLGTTRWVDVRPIGEEEQVRLEALAFATQQYVSKELLSDCALPLEVIARHIGQEAFIQIKTRILAHKDREISVSVSQPRGFCEWAKEKLAPSWALRLWPVRYTTRTVTADVYRGLPNVPVVPGTDHVRFFVKRESQS